MASIVTLTMNPALDITSDADFVRPTNKIRCSGTRYDPGGGGINVARVAHVLGGDVAAVFLAGGTSGELLTGLVRDVGVPLRRVKITGSTRESFTVNERSTTKQYRFVLQGPEVTAEEQTRCLEVLRDTAKSADFVVASGSLPPGVPPDWYQTVADLCEDIGARLILDTSGGGLTHVKSGVFLLKPSLRELRECVGDYLDTETDQAVAARDLIKGGVAHTVLVSLGADGALLVTGTRCQRFSALRVPAGSGVGAGDAMVAAIAVGLTRGWSMSKSVRYGIAAGAAMLLTPGTAICRRSEVERYFGLTADPAELSPSALETFDTSPDDVWHPRPHQANVHR
ncbi:6-phosphofructokinase 2 [Mycobacterium frederiksbergense]|uniref:6-phosphofructokinase 2 n=1 Tax=Mycolicibacterium frederiksbergense TaxID=117567 RepID=A0ABT6KTK6_9MYCO|nr:1-phosphofructokinase family hexose kinase [Mycolicibacterium frederiksbergense]MDH6194007.1 6-phosphofructokinase 2 [Mycolicibacterium frederiksbergense]